MLNRALPSGITVNDNIAISSLSGQYAMKNTKYARVLERVRPSQYFNKKGRV